MAHSAEPREPSGASERASKREQRQARQAFSKRNDFSVAVRAHIRARDAERCALCGRPGREVHHIRKRVVGGLGTADNGVCLCAACHHQVHRSQKLEKQLLRFRERVLLPFYHLATPEEAFPNERVEELYRLQEQGLLCWRPLQR